MEKSDRTDRSKDPKKQMGSPKNSSSNLLPKNSQSDNQMKCGTTTGVSKPECKPGTPTEDGSQAKQGISFRNSSQPGTRRSEVRKRQRKHRSSRTRSRERHHLETLSNQCLNKSQPVESTQMEAFETETREGEHFPFGDTFTDHRAASKDTLQRNDGAKNRETNSSRASQLADFDDNVLPKTGGVKANKGALIIPLEQKLRDNKDSPSKSARKQDGLKPTTNETYSDIFSRKQNEKIEAKDVNLGHDSRHQSQPRKRRQTLKRKLGEQEIKWRVTPELAKEESHKHKDDPGPSTTRDSGFKYVKARTPENETVATDGGVPFNTYLETYLNENMDFLKTYLRTPAEVIAGISRDPAGPVTRLTVRPQAPPGIGPTERPTEPRRILTISPASSFHDIDISTKRKGNERRPVSKLTSAKESFKKFAHLQRKSLSQIISSHQNFFQKAISSDEGSKTFWKSKFLEKNRLDNKQRSRTYAITFGWEIKRRKIRPDNQTLISNILKIRNSRKYKAAMRHNPWKRKQKVRVPAHILDEYNYLLNEYHKGLAAADAIVPILERTSYVNIPVFDNTLPNIDRHLPYTNTKTTPAYPEIPSYIKDSTDTASFISRKLKNKYGQYEKHSSVASILESSSKVSEKTQALLQASGVKARLPFTRAQPTAKGLFNADALLKIYSPKTEFTKQFSDLLPNTGRRKF